MDEPELVYLSCITSMDTWTDMFIQAEGIRGCWLFIFLQYVDDGDGIFFNVAISLCLLYVCLGGGLFCFSNVMYNNISAFGMTKD